MNADLREYVDMITELWQEYVEGKMPTREFKDAYLQLFNGLPGIPPLTLWTPLENVFETLDMYTEDAVPWEDALMPMGGLFRLSAEAVKSEVIRSLAMLHVARDRTG